MVPHELEPVVAEGGHTTVGVRFFTIADSGYFLGLVALVNSLRLQAHHDPVTVLDLGLLPEQRAALGAQCEFVRPESGLARHPFFLEPYVCLLRPAQTVVYVDSDIIVTHSLDRILAAARRGKVCAFPDMNPERWFAQWQDIFGLAAPPRHQTYVNAGFLAFSTGHFPTLLQRWSEGCARIAGHPTHHKTRDLTRPTALTSQDALNAVLMSEVARDRIEIQPPRAAAQGPDELAATSVINRTTLACRFGDRPVVLLHAWGRHKPWALEEATKLRRTAYLICLRRLLVARDMPVRTSGNHAPRWLRPGFTGAATLRMLTALSRARRVAWRVRHRITALSPRSRARFAPLRD